jgi:hypothetical protein
VTCSRKVVETYPMWNLLGCAHARRSTAGLSLPLGARYCVQPAGAATIGAANNSPVRKAMGSHPNMLA